MTDTNPVGETLETERFQLTNGDDVVTVKKLVSKGERLEINSGNNSVKLDALLLEGLSWQRDTEALDELLGANTAIATDPAVTTDDPETTSETTETTDAVSISSEYSHVLVETTTTQDGDALVITTPSRGSTITLGVQSLGELTAVENTYVFSVWFQTPFGPEDTPLEGPL